MSLITTTYAPDIYKALRGILLVHKPAGINSLDLIQELKEKISDQLNKYEPRPLASKLMIDGKFDDEKKLVEVPNLADHPLVVGPRYNPWEIRMTTFPTFLTHRASGVLPILIGPDIRYYYRKFKRTKMVSVYHIAGRFGYITDNMFSDGKITDKNTYKHIKPWKIDNILSKIEASQRDRIFDTANVPLDSEEAYQLAKAWPSKPPGMATWPVIYRLRCIHLALPEFKIEVTVCNENEKFLAHLCQDIGLALKSSAFTDSLRRVKHGMFDISDCLASSEWDLQSIVNNLMIHADYRKIHGYLDQFKRPHMVRSVHDPKRVPERISDYQRGSHINC